LAKRLGARDLPAQRDLELLLAVRDELAHFLPRPLPDEGGMPGWLVDLHRRGLLLGGADPGPGFDLGRRLCSYRLAYWAWATVDAAVGALATALGDAAAHALRTGENFRAYAARGPPPLASAVGSAVLAVTA
jgi:hypothetical protein